MADAITHRLVAPAGAVTEVMRPMQDKTAPPERVRQHIGHLAEISDQTPICPRCESTTCISLLPGTRQGICPLPDMPGARKLVAQLQNTDRR